jgi:hypothetical protein
MFFTQSDLKTGMTVELRNGERYVVFLDTCAQENDGRYKDVLIGINHEYSWLPLSMYDYNLKDAEGDGDSEWDIVKVFKPCHPYGMFANAKFNKNSSLENYEKEIKKPNPKYGTAYEMIYNEETKSANIKVITMDDIFEAFGDNVILKVN